MWSPVTRCTNCGHALRFPNTPMVGAKPVHDPEDPEKPDNPPCDDPTYDPTSVL